MKTKIRIIYESNFDDWRMGYWDEQADEWIPFTDTEDGTSAAAIALGCTPDLITALQMSMGELKDRAHSDLVDIWKRLDKLEKIIMEHTPGG